MCIYIYIYERSIRSDRVLVALFRSQGLPSVDMYIYAFSGHSSRRGIFPRHLDGPHAVVHAIRKERTKFDCTRLTRRGQVLVVFSSERKRRPLRSRGSPVWFVTIDQLYTLGVSRRVVFLRRLLCSFSPTR